MARPKKPTPEPDPDRERQRQRRKRHLDEKLDQALKETFPASDPIDLTPNDVEASAEGGADSES